MNPFSISGILILVTTLPLGIFVYLQNKKQPANELWLAYSLAISMWGFFGALIGFEHDPVKALLYWRLAMGLGIIWMPVLFYHFAYLYAPWQEKKILIGSYIITLLLALSAFTNLYIPKVEWVFGSLYWSRPGIIFYILTLWWFVMTGYSHTKLYLDSKKMPKERQNQIRFFIIASSIGYLGGLHDFSVTYGLNIYPWLNYTVVLYPFIMAYAIIRHGLFDIFIFIKRFFYSAIFVGIMSLAIGNISFVSDFLHERYGVAFWITPVLASLVALYIAYLFVESSRKADIAKQEFITIAAHKLRTPLTHIHYISEGLKNATTKEETDSLIVKLGESTDLLINLVNKVLNITNIEAQTENYHFVPIDLRQITDGILKTVNPLIQDKDIKLNFVSIENLPSAEGEEKNIKFVIQSLIENAIIYTPKGGNIDINISTEGKKKLIWSIKDSGIGIKKEDSYKIFEKFFRTENALKTDTEGTGLALSISRNLIKRHGGDIRLESEGEGKGTKFWFTLPLK